LYFVQLGVLDDSEVVLDEGPELEDPLEADDDAVELEVEAEVVLEYLIGGGIVIVVLDDLQLLVQKFPRLAKSPAAQTGEAQAKTSSINFWTHILLVMLSAAVTLVQQS